MNTYSLPLDPFLENLVRLGEQAGALIKEIYNKPDIFVQYKDDGSPFTIADIESDLLIQKGLHQLTPHLPIVSEEQPFPPLKHQDEPFWIVDPLDGTKGFLQKSGEFVVNIALIEKRRPVFGLIHIPLTAETYVAFQNQAYYIKDGVVTLLAPLLTSSEKWKVVIGHSLSKENDGIQQMKTRFPLGSIRKVGSALKFCSFATGEAHFSWRLSPCCEWDTAAADVLIEALGGCFTTFDGKPFLYGKPAYLNTDGFFVYGSKEMQYFSPTLDSLASVGQWLRQGNLAALPTETVYGLAGNGYDEKAIARIFSLKNRPQFNPLILHYADLKGMESDVILNETACFLAQEFWPGPLTFVLPRHPNSRVPLLASAGLSTVAVRIPAPPFIRQLITQEGFPLAAPSANKSGHLSPTTAAHVLQSLGQQSGILVVEGEVSCQMGIESTVLDLTEQTPYLLRPGAVPIEKIEAVLKRAILTKELSAGVYTSPGLLSSHYAPSQPVRLNVTSVEENEGLLAFGPHPCTGALLTLNLSEKEDLLEAAANLFSYLHILESSSCHQIAVMPIPEKHLGKAINDRLRRAAAPALNKAIENIII